jgi:hypothetical protein
MYQSSSPQPLPAFVCGSSGSTSSVTLSLSLSQDPPPDPSPRTKPNHPPPPSSHWGKNWDRTFTNPKCPVAPKYGDGIQKMAAMQDKHDPNRTYEPELWSRMLKNEQYVTYPRCILDRTCYCQEDIHCAEGFACVPSITFPDYKVCRPKVMN